MQNMTDELTDEQLAGILREAQKAVKEATEALQSRGYQVGAFTSCLNYDYNRIYYDSGVDYDFKIKRHKVIRTEKEL